MIEPPNFIVLEGDPYPQSIPLHQIRVIPRSEKPNTGGMKLSTYFIQENKDYFLRRFSYREGKVFDWFHYKYLNNFKTLPDGRVQVPIECKGLSEIPKNIYLHRLIYLICKGDLLADYVIDHIDRNNQNNSIDNLRQVTKTENSLNVGSHRDSKYSCIKGISFDTSRNKWIVTVRSKFIGRFSTEEEAREALLEYDSEYK